MSDIEKAPKEAGRPKSREVLVAEIIEAARNAGGIDEPVPDWLLDWAEKQEAMKMQYAWLWYNAVTVMQCYVIANRANPDFDDPPGDTWIWNHLSQPGHLPEKSELDAGEYWAKTAVPFDALAAIMDKSRG